MRASISSGLTFSPVIGGATVLSALVGVRATQRGKPWYRLLRKSKLNPPDAVFGPVWTALYALNSVSAARVYRSEPSRARTRTLALWDIEQALNAAWTPLFFGQRRPRAALADIAFVGVDRCVPARSTQGRLHGCRSGRAVSRVGELRRVPQ